MKKLIVMFTIGLLTQQVTRAQGTTYLSDLGQISTSGQAAGSDSWLATLFETGSNTSGYVLNSIELAMTDATGNPSGFTVMLYSVNTHADSALPGSSLGTLDGSLNPSTAGTYTYTDDSNITLSPKSFYFIVLTAGTTIANGAYDWSFTGVNSYNSTGGFIGGGGLYVSSDGSSWNRQSVPSGPFPQFALTATPVPEPSALGLLGLCSLLFLWHRHKTKAIP
jgi:hypothetical protein